MPLTLIQYKKGRGLEKLAEDLARELPDIVAPALTLPEQERLEGQVTPDDIIVWCVEGGKIDVNTKDIEILIWAHDFPERKANLEARKDAILSGVRDFLAGYDRNVSGFVWILLKPTAYGQI